MIFGLIFGIFSLSFNLDENKDIKRVVAKMSRDDVLKELEVLAGKADVNANLSEKLIPSFLSRYVYFSIFFFFKLSLNYFGHKIKWLFISFG